ALVSNMLDERGTYSDMPHSQFIDWLASSFLQHKEWGDELLLTLPGVFDQGQKRAYSLLGNKTIKQLGLVLEIDDQDMICGIHKMKDFVFDKNEFVTFQKSN